MARFRNDTGSVLQSQEFGVIPPGEFEVPGYDPDIHGVIPGCTRLDVPVTPEPPADPESGSAGEDLTPSRKRGKAADEHDKETLA